MKKSYAILTLLVSIVITCHAQTYYGDGAGTNGLRGSYFGRHAGAALTMDDPEGQRTENSFFGDYCGQSTRSNNNTGVGSVVLYMNTFGFDNVAVGTSSMYYNSEGVANVALGDASLSDNETGNGNTAVGSAALFFSVSSDENVAIGFNALYASGGHSNVAIGAEALESSSGDFNTGVGSGTFPWNESNLNTTTGYFALRSNTTGLLNVGFGAHALRYNTSGLLNSAFGFDAGPSNLSPDLVNTTALGANAVPTRSNRVRIGDNSVTNIGGRVAWSVISDGRFKTNVKEDVAGLEFITKLRPVSYYVDNAAANRFMGIKNDSIEVQSSARKAEREQGFIAQEVEALVKKSGYVFSGVEAPQNEHDHYSIRYSDFVVPLVKAVQELALQLQEQQKLEQQQKDEIAALNSQLATRLKGTLQRAGAGLSQTSPNPFRVDTNISMSIPETARGAILNIYSMEGKQVKSIPINGHGTISVKIQGNELAPGIYIYSLMVDGRVLDSKRMMVTAN
jgi:hypothetical protein